LLLASAATLAAQPFHQFSADMRVTSRKGTTNAKFFFGGHKIRMEMNAAGHESIMITDMDKKIVDTIMPQQQMYMEMSTEGAAASHRTPDWHMYDPSNPCATMPGTSCQKVGMEPINGRLCDKWQFTGKPGSSNRTEWIDQATGIPVKSLSADGDVWEMLNIKMGPQDPGLFVIPPGYRKMDLGSMMQGMPGMRRPQQ
jgi:hypothetical protein